MRMHCIIHADFEQPGYYKKWAKENKISISYTHLYKGEELPNTDEFDILLSMGGPQSPLHPDKYPYLKDEITLIRNSIASNKFVIGVCLGAQLIAESYGSKTQRSPHKEIGVFPVTLTSEGKIDPLFKNFPNTFLSGHWHNDMPGLPYNAKILAASEGCPRQIIRFDKKVYGFQCHLEFDQECVSGLIENCLTDLTDDTYVKDADVILNQDYEAINLQLKEFLQQLIFNKQLLDAELKTMAAL